MRILFLALLLITSIFSLAACQSNAASGNHMDDTSVRFSGTVQTGGSVSHR